MSQDNENLQMLAEISGEMSVRANALLEARKSPGLSNTIQAKTMALNESINAMKAILDHVSGEPESAEAQDLRKRLHLPSKTF